MPEKKEPVASGLNVSAVNGSEIEIGAASPALEIFGAIGEYRKPRIFLQYADQAGKTIKLTVNEQRAIHYFPLTFRIKSISTMEA